MSGKVEHFSLDVNNKIFLTSQKQIIIIPAFSEINIQSDSAGEEDERNFCRERELRTGCEIPDHWVEEQEWRDCQYIIQNIVSLFSCRIIQN